MKRASALVAAITAALSFVGVAAAAATTSSTSSTSTTTSSTTTSTTTTTTTTSPTTRPAQTPPDTIAPDPNNLAQQVSEAPPGEAQLVGLLDTVRARLANLTVQLQSLDKDLAQNQGSLDQANKDLALREADVVAADAKVADIDIAMAAARKEMRDRAVAAYIRQPIGQVVNLFFQVRDPAELNDVKAFYQALVDAQAKTVARFDRLQSDAKKAAADATRARNLAKAQRESVIRQQATLTALQSTFRLVQQESQDQENQQTTLLSQANADKAQFAAAVKAQQDLSDQIAALLRQVEQAGGPALPATNGFLQLPIPGSPITSPFGPRADPITGTLGFHPGVDFGATFGTPIQAAADGTVVWAGPNGGYGNCTIIDHGHSLATLYAHQSLIIVHVGDQVTRGQMIGQVGSTGYSTGPHLHFEVRISGTPVDPVPYL